MTQPSPSKPVDEVARSVRRLLHRRLLTERAMLSGAERDVKLHEWGGGRFRARLRSMLDDVIDNDRLSPGGIMAMHLYFRR